MMLMAKSGDKNFWKRSNLSNFFDVNIRQQNKCHHQETILHPDSGSQRAQNFDFKSYLQSNVMIASTILMVCLIDSIVWALLID